VNWASLSNSLPLVCSSGIEAQAGLTPNGAAVPRSPYLYLEYFTPHVGYVPPREISYDVFELTAYTQSQNANFVAGATTTLSNNNIKLSNSTPTRLFVFCRYDPNNLGVAVGGAAQVNAANHFFPIEGLNITFNNQTGLLSSATRQQLWDLSRGNGLE